MHFELRRKNGLVYSTHDTLNHVISYVYENIWGMEFEDLELYLMDKHGMDHFLANGDGLRNISQYISSKVAYDGR